MPREHANIKFTDEELREFLASDTRLILATLSADDSPWADAAAYCFADDRIWFRIPVDTRSYDNIARDDRVCCVVESKPADSSYYDIKGAMMHGRARPLGDDDGPADVRAALARIPDPVEPNRSADSAVFSIGLEDYTSFSFQKIQGRYQDRPLSSLG